ncbi:hypothetical protein VaNZ11_003541 [Volvox africanus]|uniref:WW domain-containing protein n=1 Tax=Volvox africanus TaxID=51714 RepID=A0ABQ5RUE9_9CHLO|nr:hypothetical protein VaNZ11_003541 [Volvox africanus]
MVHLLRPKYIQELASLLDVKAALEWALPYALASIPLPEGWTCLADDNDESFLFVSDIGPHAPQREHPLLGRAAQALAQLRANGTGGGSEVRMLGPFENPESPAVEYFYIDIHTGQQVPEFECPPGAIIQPLPKEILQLLTAAGSPPSVPDQQQQQQDPEHPAGHEADAQPSPLGGDTNVSMNDSAGPPGAAAKPAAMAGPTSQPQSASSSTSRNGNAGNAAGGVAAGSQSPSKSASASRLLRRQGSDSNADSWQEPGGGDGGASGAGAEPMAATAASYPRPMPTASAASPTQPAPPPPPPGIPLAAAAAAATVGSSKSFGLGSDYYDKDTEEVPYVRGESTTAGYAGSVSENDTGGRTSENTSVGVGVGDGNRRGGRNSGNSRSNGSGTGGVEGGGGGGGGGASSSVREPPSRFGSNRSSETTGSEGYGEGRIGAGSGTNGGAATGGTGVRAAVPPPSGRLTFFGWWFEDIESSDLTFRIDTNPTAGGGLAPRHCKLVYDFDTSSYNFTMRDPVTPPAPGQPHERVPELTIPGICGEQVAMCDTGRPADPWDLHLGARLRVLGRQVILKNSDLATAQWHTSYFKQLCGLRDKLHQEVQKYKPRVIRPGLVADKGDVRLQTGQQLRHVVLQIREMIDDLRQYRPRKAESFLAALPIQL